MERTDFKTDLEKRLEQLLSNCFDYLCELKDHEGKEEMEYFWKEVIGLNDEEIKYWCLDEEE